MRLDLHFAGTALFVNLVPRVGEIRRSDFTAGHLGKPSRALTVADSLYTLRAFSGFVKMQPHGVSCLVARYECEETTNS